MTYTELEQMPDDGRRYELYDGEVRVVPSPTPLHQLLVDRVASELNAYRRQFGGLVFFAPLDVVFSELNIAQPDIMFFACDRTHLIDLRKPIRVAPDVAVEVLLPSTTAIDRGKKMRMFARFGVMEYWLIDPESRAIEVYRLIDHVYVAQTAPDSDMASSAVLPAFAVKLSALFDF